MSSTPPSAMISIHAPERGATVTIILNLVAASNFNPRPRAGSDVKGFLYVSEPITFQSTPPSGERHARTVRIM